MLTSAHKKLLQTITRKHAVDLRSSLSVVREHLDPSAPQVRQVELALLLAEDTLRALETEPVQAAA